MTSYKIEHNLLSTSKYNIKSPFTMTPQFITVHNTANDASADNEVAYMNRNNSQVSYHAAIDDKKVIIAIPYNRIAWHCGDGRGNGNMKSIGLEICYSKSGGPKYVQAEQNAVVYIAKLLKEYGWGIDRVKQHYDWSKKNCPHRIRSEGRWKSFLARIEQEMKDTPKSVESPKTEVKSTSGTAPTPAKTTVKTVKGTITILVDKLNYYDGPRWNEPVGTVRKNEVFTVVGKILVDGAYQYMLKSGTYITASDKYVKFK